MKDRVQVPALHKLKVLPTLVRIYMISKYVSSLKTQLSLSLCRLRSMSKPNRRQNGNVAAQK
jgi:hypothetical protein